MAFPRRTFIEAGSAAGAPPVANQHMQALNAVARFVGRTPTRSFASIATGQPTQIFPARSVPLPAVANVAAIPTSPFRSSSPATRTQCSDLQVDNTLGHARHVFPVPAPHAQLAIRHASQERADFASASKQPRQWQCPFASCLYAAQHALIAAGIEPTVLPILTCQRRSLVSPPPQHGEPEPEPCRPRCRPQLASATHDQLPDHEE